MRLQILAIGKGLGGPEAALAGAYVDRLNALAPRSRIGPASLRELEARGGREGETQALLAAAEKTGAERRVALDERGRALPSRAFAETLGRWRDDGVREAAFLIGGADGHASAAREQADLVLSFGAATWPHGLVRALLAEQLYRAATILIGHPYHRD